MNDKKPSTAWAMDKGTWSQQTQTTHRAIHHRGKHSWFWVVRRGNIDGDVIAAGEASSLDQARQLAARHGVTLLND
jgi:hypothetical protein